MIERFLARVGKAGAIAILVAAILVIGFGGAVVEHYRLAAQTEQQGEQNSGEASSKSDKEGDARSNQGNQSGSSQQSQGNDTASGARQQQSGSED